ncbi:L-fuco-beta-pyranose dehydrogenase [Caballeronia glathei]|jgi:predicted dehydrogenase|uniref:Oxidoreductase n=1 Tax=Caballeronia glathei TaxID=60547 RepID=A0A069PT93_9BURK|nr:MULTISPECIES: Gfo/Idh/MocA family oxidoreductase [Burkholderiaceae]KDR43820.1 oxidoreductase [Caballeronia glathei]TCK43888.1 putative dehydrogenase [Paraburkholderia sp. BL8N3]CDY75617.1 L-fuco-beta-pyranose dehydrogenase [Caballeronia glathei]
MSNDTTIRWGIVGAGRIARRFAQGLAHVPGAVLSGVWSRRPEPARALAAAFGARAFDSFDALMGGIDALYIATMQDSHPQYALAAFSAGKPVLCEKPAAVNARTLQKMIDTARASKLLFMEAMKPPFYPLYGQLRAHLAADPIGAIGLVRAGCSMANVPLDHPSYSMDSGGGALLDIGVYEAFLAVDWLGEALDVQTIGRLGPTGVDTFASLNVRHERGVAQLFCGMDLQGRGDALIGGTLGTATIHENWWNPARATVRYLDGRTVELDAPFEGGGLNYETAHFCELLRAGAIESPVMSHATSMRMIAIIDAARRDLGLRFPFESE